MWLEEHYARALISSELLNVIFLSMDEYYICEQLKKQIYLDFTSNVLIMEWRYISIHGTVNL